MGGIMSRWHFGWVAFIRSALKNVYGFSVLLFAQNWRNHIRSALCRPNENVFGKFTISV